MKKSKYLFIFFLAGCFFNQNQSTILSQYFPSKKITREIAGGTKRQCFKQLFSVKNLKNEVSEFEKKYERFEKVEGSWKHLDLKQLPIPQANFLLRFGDKIGKLPLADDVFKDCGDLVCVINRIYSDRNELAGFVHYLWYLKFGNMLSFDNFIPKQKSKKPGEYSNKEIPFENYLFLDDELYAFWKLSFLLDDPFLSLEKLVEIQRIPNGEQFEQKSHRNFCGLSSPAGWITLTDKCLEIQNEGEGGYLFSAVTHELSHHLDYELGMKESNSNPRSLLPDYLEVSDFYLEEYIDEENFVQRNWKLKDDVKSVNDYASLSPQENFAELVSMFRLSGDELKEAISEKHYKFLRDKIFQGKEFLYENSFEFMLQKRRGDIFRFVLKDFSECQMEEECFENKLDFLSEEFLAIIQREEPSGCELTESKKSREKFEETFKNFALEEIEAIRSYDLTWDDYSKVKDMDLENKAILSYLKCYDENNKKDCYEKVSDQENLIIRRLYPFESLDVSLKRKYKDLIFGMNQIILKNSKKIWDFCKIEGSDNSVEFLSGPFVVSDGYMKSTQFSCLNKSIESSVDSIYYAFGENNHPVEEKILKELILSSCVKMLHDLYQIEKKAEYESVRGFIPSMNDSELIQKNKCQKLKKASLNFRYHLWKDFIKTSSVCGDF